MIKKILIGVLAAVVIGAAGVSAYNVLAGESAVKAASPAPNGAQAGYGQAGQGTAYRTPLAQQNPAQGTGLAGANAQGQQDRGNGSRGGGNGRRQGQNGNGGQSAYATPNPQNGFTEALSFHGTISAYNPPTFTLLTDDGQSINAQLGNQSYVANLGLTLSNGDSVSISGYWDTSGAFAVQQITLDSSGQTYLLRDNLGRPLWRGGANH